MSTSPNEWYYTSAGRQCGPVAWEQLKNLADKGHVQPNDLVWTSGMGDWVKANLQPGLFQANSSAGITTSETVEFRPEAEPASRKRRLLDRDDEDDGDADRPRSRKRLLDREDDEEGDDRPRRRKRPKEAGSNAAIYVIGGGIGLLVLMVACGGFFYFMSGGGGGGGGDRNFTFSNLRAGAFAERVVHLDQGKQVTVKMTSRVIGRGAADVDLHVHDGNLGNVVIASDVTIGPNGAVQFVVPRTGPYRVRVMNLGPGNATSTVVVDVN